MPTGPLKREKKRQSVNNGPADKKKKVPICEKIDSPWGTREAREKRTTSGTMKK